MLNQPLPRPIEAAPAATAVPGTEAVLVDVVLLSADPHLFQTLRDAVGERNPVWRARSAEEAANLLITGRCGVLVIDTAAVSTRADTLIEQIVEQFPDVVVCVAGTRDDEPLLAPLISHGLVYRFIHKPTSARRAGMFLQAAMRRHVEHREGGQARDPLLGGLHRHTAAMRGRYLALIGVLTLALTVPLFIDDAPSDTAPTATNASLPGSAPSPSSAARADPVLSRARAALQAGRLESPAGRNALDLFHGVLLAEPDQPEALTSLDRTVNLLLERAQQELDAGRKAEAERLVQRVLSVVPDHQAARALAVRVNPPDTPSRQLSREQRAEVESGLAASPVIEVAVISRPKTLQEIAAELAALPEPVTVTAPPAVSPAPRAVATRTPPQVQPDPLAARFANPLPATRPVIRSYARAIARPLPTAAVVAPAETGESVVTSAAAVVPAPAPVPNSVAADTLQRVAGGAPVYPPQALRNGTSGRVELEFTILPDGSVRDIQVVAAEPSGVFEGAARDAVAAWRFRPRLANGQPVSQRSTVTLRFDVDR